MTPRMLAVAGLALLTAAPALAWNDHGHMVVARVAWRELSENERGKVIALLKFHPHFDSYLKADKPANMTEDEWVFLRAATWADFIKHAKLTTIAPLGNGDRNAVRHFVNTPFVRPGDNFDVPAEAKGDNVILGLTGCRQRALSGSERDKRAMDIAWCFHLVGDIHQPLHCITLFGDDFPQGDKGGVRADFRLSQSSDHALQLHSFWDGLLGKPLTLSAIGTSATEAETAIKDNAQASADLAAHTTPESWAKESYDLAVQVAYLNGTLGLRNHDHGDGALPPVAPSTYPQHAGEAARFAVGKAGKRLATLLREVIANN